MTTLFLIGAALLLLLNFLLVFFLRRETSFTRYHGALSVILIILFGAYLVYTMYSSEKLATVKTNAKGKSTVVNLNLKIGKVQPETSQEVQQRELIEQQAIQRQREEVIDYISLFLNLIVVQSIYGIIAALTGMKVLMYMRRYYLGFCVLHTVVAALAWAAKYVITQRM